MKLNTKTRHAIITIVKSIKPTSEYTIHDTESQHTGSVFALKPESKDDSYCSKGTGRRKIKSSQFVSSIGYDDSAQQRSKIKEREAIGGEVFIHTYRLCVHIKVEIGYKESARTVMVSTI